MVYGKVNTNARYDMEIGVSTASYFNKMQNEDAVLDIGAHGVRVCELFLNSFSEYEPDFIALLNERMARAKLRAYSIHPMGTQFEPQLFSLHPRQRGDAWKLYEKVLRCGKLLNASHYVMHGFASMSGTVRNVGLDRIGPILTDLAAMAKDYGVQLTVENVSWCMFSTPDFGVRLLDKIGGGKVKFTLDVKQSIRSGCTPLQFIDAVGDEIVNLHLCDAQVAADGGFQLRMPGEGNVDFAAVRDALAAHGYSGPAFIEVYSDMYAETQGIYLSLDRMKRVFS